MKTNVFFSKGQKATEYLTGEIHVQMLIVDGVNFDTMSYNVLFAPRSRTDWHSHPGGQILYCTSDSFFGTSDWIQRYNDKVNVCGSYIESHLENHFRLTISA